MNLDKFPNLQWHRVQAVPVVDSYPLGKEDADDDIELEGEMPESNSCGLLVALKDGTIVYSTGFDEDYELFDCVESCEVAFWAYASWKQENGDKNDDD